MSETKKDGKNSSKNGACEWYKDSATPKSNIVRDRGTGPGVAKRDGNSKK